MSDVHKPRAAGGEMRKIVTTDDIARALNISRSTVSRALNDHALVNAGTRARVLETAVPLASLGVAAGQGVRFQFSMWQGGLPLDARTVTEDIVRQEGLCAPRSRLRPRK